MNTLPFRESYFNNADYKAVNKPPTERVEIRDDTPKMGKRMNIQSTAQIHQSNLVKYLLGDQSI